MGRRPKQTFLQRRYTDCQQTHERMLNIVNHQRNANQNHNDVSPHMDQHGHHQKILQAIDAGEGVEKREPSCTVFWEFKLVQPLYRTVWRFLKILKIELLFDPLLGIYPEKTIIQKYTCITIFIAVLFTIARTWNQPKCPSTGEWIMKMWHIYTVEYYPALQRNELSYLQ